MIGIIPVTLIIDDRMKQKENAQTIILSFDFKGIVLCVCVGGRLGFVLLNCCCSLHVSACVYMCVCLYMCVRSVLHISSSSAILLCTHPHLHHHHHHHHPSGGIRESPAAPAGLHKANKIKFALLNQSLYGIPSRSLWDKLLQTASFVS